MKNVLSEINESIWMIHEPALEDVRAFLRSPENFTAFDTDQDEDEEFSSRLIKREGPLATVQIHGKIMPRSNIMTRSSGATSTAELSRAVDEIAEDDSIEKVLFHVDSPGGSPNGLANLTQKIRSLDKETIAFAQGTMASAAYWIGSAADKVVASPMAKVGSIGVYALLTSKSEKLEDEGVETKVVRSAPLKAKPHPSEPIDEEAVKNVQSQVDKLHKEFVKEVSLNRNISQEKAQAMADGDVEVGSEAEEANLTDDTMTLAELYKSEFQFDESAEGDRQEQQISFLESNVERLLNENSQLRTQISELKGQVESLSESHEEMLDAEIEARLDKAIEENQKFAPAKREELRSRIESDLEATEGDVNLNDLPTVEMIDMVDSGAAAPDGPVNTPDTESMSSERKAEKLESQGVLVARSEDEAQIYERAAQYEEGEDFVRMDKIGTYGFFDES